MMDWTRIIFLSVASLLVAEGFVLSLFPQQLQAALAEADPRLLQVAGWFETACALALFAGALAR